MCAGICQQQLNIFKKVEIYFPFSQNDRVPKPTNALREKKGSDPCEEEEGPTYMGKGNNNDRYVVKREEGYAVVKEDHKRASALKRTQKEAIERRRDTGNLGGGEVRVQGRDGKFRDGKRVKKRWIAA